LVKENFYLTKLKGTTLSINVLMLVVSGKLNNVQEGIIRDRKIITKGYRLLPMYTVFIPALNQVSLPCFIILYGLL
jgi:hypothetical protein